MDHPETDAPLPASDDQLSPADSSLPHLLYALEIETPTLVPSDSLPVHHEEIVIDAPEPLPGADDGTQEYPVLSVEVPSLVDEIDDLPTVLWFPDDNLAVVQNGYSASNHQFLDLVATSAPDPLASSDESLYYDAETGEVEPTVSEPGVGHMARNDPGAGLALVDSPEDAPAGVGQMARNNPGTGLALVDSPEDAPAPPENFDSPGDSELAPVEEFVHLPPAIPEAPLALPEEDDDPLVFDPLEASPLLDSLGFARVQRAYDRWLQNMSHSISIFQGMFSQD